MRDPFAPTVVIDLSRISANATGIARRTGVPLIAVVKADAYGLGIDRVLPALAEVACGFCVFSLAEAASAQIKQRTGKPVLALAPVGSEDAEDWIAAGVRPAVSDVSRAAALRRANPVLAVDTGMQRFASPRSHVAAILQTGECTEAFTHATSLEQVAALREAVAGHDLFLHAAGSSLLHEPAAWLDAVRPGVALYTGAVRAAARLIEARDTAGPAGYTRFAARRHGVILSGYTTGLRPGPCIVNGRRSQVIEVGMQSAFVALDPGDAIGDEVILLGDGLTESEVAAAWKVSSQEVLTRICRLGERQYFGYNGSSAR
jgi:alanine racemase